jgi:Flp pilus assembly protein TadG
MSANSPRRAAPRRAHPAQAGVFVVEFAIVAMVFFLFLFGVMEMARIMYVINTLQEVTRRAAQAAASANFSDAGTMAALRQFAVFRSTPGALVLADPVSDASVRIDYLALAVVAGHMTLVPMASSSLPASPARNRLNCTSDPNGAACISFVRVRVCAAAVAASCVPVTYRSLLSFVDMPFGLPLSTTIVKAESLGYVPGMPL